MRIPIQRLIKISSRSSHTRFHHVCLVMKSGNIISEGVNHGIRHAEISALEKLDPERRIGTTIISFMVRSTGTIGPSYPCTICLEYLRQHRIAKLTYHNGTEFVTARIKDCRNDHDISRSHSYDHALSLRRKLRLGQTF